MLAALQVPWAVSTPVTVLAGPGRTPIHRATDCHPPVSCIAGDDCRSWLFLCATNSGHRPGRPRAAAFTPPRPTRRQRHPRVLPTSPVPVPRALVSGESTHTFSRCVRVCARGQASERTFQNMAAVLTPGGRARGRLAPAPAHCHVFSLFPQRGKPVMPFKSVRHPLTKMQVLPSREGLSITARGTRQV